MGKVLLGIVLGVILVPAAVLVWFQFGKVPVAVADPPFPQEQLLTAVPLHARIDRDLIKTAPIQSDEATTRPARPTGRSPMASASPACHRIRKS